MKSCADLESRKTKILATIDLKNIKLEHRIHLYDESYLDFLTESAHNKIY